MLAILFLNFAILFFAINLLIFAGQSVKNIIHPKKNNLQRIHNVSLQKVYPGYSQQKIDDLLAEIWSRELEFEEFTQFKERATQGKYVNVSSSGYRLTVPQGPWPPDSTAYNIFLFGGSTTFGYGVADGDTIATFLQKDLKTAFRGKNIWVYNFGRGFYYSSQESILFQRLLVNGYKPNMAIFIDGLNEFLKGPGDEPVNTDDLHNHMEVQATNTNTPLTIAASRFIDNLPMMRFVQYIKAYGAKPWDRLPPLTSKQVVTNKYNNKDELLTMIQRYFANKKVTEGVSEIYHIPAIFVLQPVPFYKYDLSYNLFYKGFSDPRLTSNCENSCYSLYGYPLLASKLKDTDQSDLIWLGDMQEGEHKPLYVDPFHYTADMHGQIAARLMAFIQEHRFLPQ